MTLPVVRALTELSLELKKKLSTVLLKLRKEFLSVSFQVVWQVMAWLLLIQKWMELVLCVQSERTVTNLEQLAANPVLTCFPTQALDLLEQPQSMLVVCFELF